MLSAAPSPDGRKTCIREKPTLAQFLEREKLWLVDSCGDLTDPGTEVEKLARWKGDADGAKPLNPFIPFKIEDGVERTTRQKYAKRTAPGRHRSAKAVSSLLCLRKADIGRRVRATLADCTVTFKQNEEAVTATLSKVTPDARGPRWEALKEETDARMLVEVDDEDAVVEILEGRGGYEGMAEALGLLRALPSDAFSQARAVGVWSLENTTTYNVEIITRDGRDVREERDAVWIYPLIQAVVATFQPRCRPRSGFRTRLTPERMACHFEVPMIPNSAVLRARAALRRKDDAARLRRHLVAHGASEEAVNAFDIIENIGRIRRELDRIEAT